MGQLHFNQRKLKAWHFYRISFLWATQLLQVFPVSDRLLHQVEEANV